MKRSDRDYIDHMIDDCTDINTALTMVDSVDDFKQNRIVHKAVIYSLLNLGELCKKLTELEKDAYPHIPWNRIISFRNRSSHGYHHLDLDIVYEIATKYIPDLLNALLD